MLELFDEYRIRATVSLDLAVLEQLPQIRDAGLLIVLQTLYP
jgi:hypothetical protein